jgi:hypothetical protein
MSVLKYSIRARAALLQGTIAQRHDWNMQHLCDYDSHRIAAGMKLCCSYRQKAAFVARL